MVYRYLHDRERSVRLIHSRYTRADRAEHEQASIKTLQTEGIVVSTQVCEAGLDVSAEILITELAPADSLIQRSGRCARRAGEKGRVLIFGADEKPYEAEHLDITATYLDEHPKLDLTDWMETCDLADTMTYEADDVAARDSLFDLFEATLYADARPGHLAVREGKYVQALLGDPAELDLSDDALRHDRLLTLPHGFAYGLHEHQALYTDKSDKLIRLQYSADGEDPVKRWVAEADTQTPLPFRTYFLKSEFYDSELGVIAHDAAGGTN
jgi:CRISPR-associated endonuclease/helicase Cas3